MAEQEVSGTTPLPSLTGPDEEPEGNQPGLLSVPQRQEKEWLERLEQENGHLHSQVKHFQEVLNGIKDGFAVLDSEMRFTYVNPPFAEIGGFTPLECTGRSIWEAFPDLAGTDLELNCRKTMQERKPVQFDLTDTGSDSCYSISISPVDSGISIYWKDLSLSRRTKTQRNRLLQENRNQLEQLASERSRLETVLAHSPVGVIVVNARGGIRYYNPAAQQIIGQSIPFSKDYSSHDLLPLFYPDGPAVPPRERPLVKSALDGETLINYQYDIVWADGQRICITGSSAPIYDTQGSISGAVAVFSDITRQKQAERDSAFLYSLGKWLMEVRSPQEVIDGAVEQIGVYLKVDRCILADVNSKGRKYQIVGDYHKGLPKIHLDLPVEEFPEMLRTAFNSGQPVVLEDLSMELELKGVADAFANLYQIRSFLTIPWLDTSGRWGALLTVARSKPHAWSQEVVKFLSAATGMIWLAVQNARLYTDLQNSRERFHLALKDSPIFTGSTDRQLRFTWVYNPFLGFTAEATLGKRIDELLASEKAAQAMNAMQAVLDSGKGQHSEWTYLHEDGTTYTYDLFLEPLPGSEGGPAGVSMVAIDITDRKKLEKELIRRETQYRLMLNTTFDGVWIIDQDGKTSFINDHGAAILGCTPREMTGGSSRAYIFPEDLPREAKNWKRRQQGINQFSEQRLRHKEGHEIWILSSTSLIEGDNEEYQGTLMMFRDITSQKLAEAALRESNERFRIALKAAPITVFNTDDQLRYTWVYNPHGSISSGEIVGKRDEEILAAEDAAEMIALKQSVIDSGVGVRKEVRLKHSGKWAVYDINLEPLLGSLGQIVGLVGAAMDVTAQHRIEEESSRNRSRVDVQRRLIQQREQERLQIARDLHDTVLQELIGVHFTLSEAISIPDKDMRLRKMESLQHEIRTQIHTLRNYCNDLRPPSLAPFGLERAIRSHISTFRERYPGYTCSLNLYKDGQTLPEEIRMVLYRVYQEALSNIVKHAHADRVWVRLSVRKNRVEIEIKDNGKGFHLPERWPEQMAHSGHFGLLGMQERVEAVGGRLQIRTQVGRGTRVISIIPIEDLTTQETEQL